MEERRAHPKCINYSNPVHECTDYCFRKIAERGDTGPTPLNTLETDSIPSNSALPSDFGRHQTKRRRDEADEAITSATFRAKEQAPQKELEVPESVTEHDTEEQEPEEAMPDLESMTPVQKKLFEMRLKLNQARKANQVAVVAEKRKEEQPQETRGISKQKWFEEKKRKIGKQLEANGLDITKAYMLETQKDAEAKYKTWDKKEAAFGWDVFNQRSLYRAYKKRSDKLEPDMEAYNHAKAGDPEFFRDSASLQYGKPVNDSEANVDRMVKELEDRRNSQKEFSRRRKYHEEKDVDSINDRNEHFNRKIERAFGKYTVEIKNNLERGTALPD